MGSQSSPHSRNSHLSPTKTMLRQTRTPQRMSSPRLPFQLPPPPSFALEDRPGFVIELEDSMEDQVHTAKSTPASSMLGKDSLHSLVASLSSDDLCNFKKNIFTGLFCLLLPSSKPAIHRNCMYN